MDTTQVQDIVKSVNQKLKKASLQLISSGTIEKIPTISTQVPQFDYATGIGGIPIGRITEIFGTEGSGKTTLALHIAAETCSMGGIVCYIDGEHALDPNYAKIIGCDLESFIISQPDTLEQGLDVLEHTINEIREVDTDVPIMLIFDSLASLPPKAELEGTHEDYQIGLVARLFNKALRRLTGKISKNNVCLVVLNQLRENIGGFGYGKAELTPGGRGLKFHASLRVELRSRKFDKDNKCYLTTFKIAKNKMAPPFTKAEAWIKFNKGFMKQRAWLDFGTDLGVIEQKGPWITMKVEGEDLVKVKGWKGWLEVIGKDSQILEVLKAKIMECE